MLRILTYHRVADPHSTPWLNPGMVSALPSVFEGQVDHLARRYRVLCLDEVLDAVVRRKKITGRAVLITFDDAYRDFGEIAWPILRRHKLPATLFVPTAYPGDSERSFWWDRLFAAISRASGDTLTVPGLGDLPLWNQQARWRTLRHIQDFVKSLPNEQGVRLIDTLCDSTITPGRRERVVHSWHELRSLARDGVSLGSHARTHALLTRLTPEEVRNEVRGAAQDLMNETGSAPPVFCYPAGAHDDTVVRILKEEGIVAAVTVLDGQNELSKDDALRLRRTNVTPRTSLPIFRLRLHRWASYLDRARHLPAGPRSMLSRPGTAGAAR